MIQFYAMPLSGDERATMLQAMFWINASGSPLDVFATAQRHLQDGAESIELPRGDWLDLQRRIEQWGKQDGSRRRDALKLAILIDSMFCGEPSRVIEDPVKVAAPVDRQGSLFDGD